MSVNRSTRRKGVKKIISEAWILLVANYKSIILNIFTIVFSIFFAQYIDKIREVERKRADVKDFLIDLKSDLQSNIAELENDKKVYQYYAEAFQFFIGINNQQGLDESDYEKYIGATQNTRLLFLKDGQYEGFKQSGKLTNIENKRLLTDILEYYQNDIPMLKNEISNYQNLKNQFQQQVILDVQLDKNINIINFGNILAKHRIKILCVLLSSTEDIEEYLDKAIVKSKKVIEGIDKQLQDS